MKKITVLSFILLSVVLLSAGFMQDDNNIYVLVKYKSQPGKNSKALTELKNLVKQVKEEPGYVKISIYSDPSDPTNILLYEQWSNEDYYKGDHMKTAHLQKFISDSRDFLAGPPEITFWKMEE